MRNVHVSVWQNRVAALACLRMNRVPSYKSKAKDGGGQIRVHEYTRPDDSQIRQGVSPLNGPGPEPLGTALPRE